MSFFNTEVQSYRGLDKNPQKSHKNNRAVLLKRKWYLPEARFYLGRFARNYF